MSRMNLPITILLLFHFRFFLKSLRDSVEKTEDNTMGLGPLIQRCERKLHMYVIYCKNKPVSEHIVAEHSGYFEEIRKKLKHKLLVSAIFGYIIFNIYDLLSLL